MVKPLSPQNARKDAK